MSDLPVTVVQALLRKTAEHQHDATQPGITKLFGVEHPAMFKQLTIEGDPYSRVPFVALESHIPLLNGGGIRVNSEISGVLREMNGLGHEWSGNNHMHSIESLLTPTTSNAQHYSDTPGTQLFHYDGEGYDIQLSKSGHILHERFGHNGTILYDKGKHVNEHIADLQDHPLLHSPEKHREIMQHLYAGSRTKSLDEGVLKYPNGSYSSVSYVNGDLPNDDTLTSLTFPLHGIHVVHSVKDSASKASWPYVHYNHSHYVYHPDTEQLHRIA